MRMWITDGEVAGGLEIALYIAGLLAAIVLLIAAARSIAEWRQASRAPVLTVSADVVDRRMGTGVNRGARYVTFQVESGDRMELRVSGSDYGSLSRGDCGRLTFRGRRCLGFERQ